MRQGISLLLLEYRGYGRSEGKPSEEGSYADARAAWRHLVAERGFPPERIVLVGESLGGGVVARLAAAERPGALVLASSFVSVPELAAELYPWLSARWLARYRYDTLEALARVLSPVLIAHSRQDISCRFATASGCLPPPGGRKRFWRWPVAITRAFCSRVRLGERRWGSSWGSTSRRVP
jgi:pimeloyl-ACP methyl ester carboxylesterase